MTSSRQGVFISSLALPISGIAALFNLLKPTGHVTQQQFNIQQLYVLPTLYLCVLYLSENSDLCHLQHKPIGFYNREEKCLLRGTNWVFKQSSLLYLSENKQRLVPLTA